MTVWLIGAGTMSVAYAKVLTALDAKFQVIGRGSGSANQFEAATGIKVVRGGLDHALNEIGTVPRQAIVSVGVDALYETSMRLLRAGVRSLLIEKPGALEAVEIESLEQTAVAHDAKVFIAYNRRFYAATLQARHLIAADGGLQSCNFEFTEWGHEIETLDKPNRVKERWFLANSTHVVDLVFYLAGAPRELVSFTDGSISWHPTASRFSGAGVTDRGVLLSYQANWEAPGRWGVEANTANHRLIFRPMEVLQIVRKGSVKIEPVNLDDRLDKEFKPGLYEQVRHFLADNDEGLCSMREHAAHWPWYCRIAGYLES